jgi:hypothetical protein
VPKRRVPYDGLTITKFRVRNRKDLDAAHDRGDTAEVERLKKLHLKDTGEHIEPMEPIMRTMKNYMARVPLANNMDKNAPKNVPPVHMDRPFNHFLEGIPFDELIQALATTQGTKYKRAFATLNADAKYREANPNKKIRSVAGGLRDCGITLQDLMETYGRYRTASAVRIAMDRSPQIIAHAADDAQNRKVYCPRCDGLGEISADDGFRICPECKGAKEITQSGDGEARKLVLEVAGIAGKKGPVVDARSVHYGHGVFSVESLVRGMEQLEAPEDSSIIEAETEEVEGDGDTD